MASFLSTNGAGIATDPANIPTKINKGNALGELYPPILENTIPPVIIPKNGAVRQVKA